MTAKSQVPRKRTLIGVHRAGGDESDPSGRRVAGEASKRTVNDTSNYEKHGVRCFPTVVVIEARDTILAIP